MRTANVDLYEFNELPDNIKEKVLNNLRDINVEFDNWYDYMFDDYKEQLLKMGYDNVDIVFSGFWSQGDGASFTADVDIKNISRRVFTPEEYDFFWHYCYAYCSEGVYRVNSRYYHHNTILCGDVEFETSLKLYDALNDERKRISDTAELIEAKLQDMCKDIMNYITYEAREYSRRIYGELESEYENLISDESIIETIAANEYEFTSDGELAKHIYYDTEREE